MSSTLFVLRRQKITKNMEEQWAYYHQEEGVDDLRQSLLYSTLEIGAALVSAHEEISRKDEEILQLNSLLTKIIKEKDEFQAKSQELVQEKQLLFQQMQMLPHSSKQHLDACPVSSGTTSNEDGHNIDLSPSDCDESIVITTSSLAQCKDTMPLAHPPHSSPNIDVTGKIALKKPLPEQGKFLQAVMEAGPLLQTLIPAGALPRWQNPPPQLHSVDIPPVTILSPKFLSQYSCLVSPTSDGFTNKRVVVDGDGSDLSPCSKYQKVCSPIIFEPVNI